MANKRVLIVEDEASIRAVIRELLERSGYEPTEAADGTEGLAQAEGTHPDVILLDIWMPGLDGFEVYRRLKQNPATAAIPVIFLTGVQDLTLERLAYEAGAVACITKPFRTGALMAVIEATILSAELKAKPTRKGEGDGRCWAAAWRTNREHPLARREETLRHALAQVQNITKRRTRPGPRPTEGRNGSWSKHWTVDE